MPKSPVERITHAERAARRRRIADYVVETNCTAKGAALHFGVSAGLVGMACLENAVAPARGLKNRVSPNTYCIIADLLNTDLSLKEIAGRRGVTREFVRQVQESCVRAGVPVRPRVGAGRSSPGGSLPLTTLPPEEGA